MIWKDKKVIKTFIKVQSKKKVLKNKDSIDIVKQRKWKMAFKTRTFMSHDSKVFRNNGQIQSFASGKPSPNMKHYIT